MKNILILATGGTIASVKTDEGLRPAYKPQEMIDLIPELKDIANLEGKLIMNIDSSDMVPERWIEIADSIDKDKDSYDGIVVLHGTDTMSYTSSALSLMLRGIDKPVVITGAMKGIGEEGSDAIGNMINAVKFATEEYKGVYCVFDSKVYQGSRISKVNPSSVNAFENINSSLVGEFKKGEFNKDSDYNSSLEDLVYEKDTKISDKVYYMYLTPGMKTEVIDKVLELGYKGIVIGGYGDGNFPLRFLDKFEEVLDKNIPLVLGSQCLKGKVDAAYEAGFKLMKKGAISAKDMTNEMAVTKLMYAIGHSDNLEKIKEIMSENYANEISE